MKPERVVEPPIPFEGSPCDWLLSRDPDTKRWLTLHRDEVAELGAAAISLAALRYIKYKHEAYYGGQDKWALWAGVDESTIKRHQNILVEGGYIKLDGRHGPLYNRYKLSRKAPVIEDNDAYSVLPLGFLSRVKPLNDRITFSLVVSSFRRAEGIFRKIYPDLEMNEQDFFDNVSHYECNLHQSTHGELFRLTTTTAAKWGVSERGFRDAKNRLRKQELIESGGSDETYIMPSGRSAQFSEIASWF